MKIYIQSVHFDADKKLLDYITHKVEKTKRFFENINKVNVYLRLEKDSHNENKSVEIKLNLLSHKIFAKIHSSKFETATDLVMEKIINQVKKQKEKIQNKAA